jgi:LacI family transcriptional regulator
MRRRSIRANLAAAWNQACWRLLSEWDIIILHKLYSDRRNLRGVSCIHGNKENESAFILLNRWPGGIDVDPTIYEVATLAGVSLATVSRVLNNNPNVRPSTREKVLTAIKELGYQPNLLASALMTKQTRTIGLLVPDISNPYFAELCRSVEDACAARGFSTVICNTDERLDREERQITLLRQKGVDGMIFASALEGDENILRLIKSEYPVVLLSRGLDGQPVDQVTVDDLEGGLVATRYLLGLGHRRIALFSGPLRSTPGLYRKKGFEAALELAGMTVDTSLMESGQFTITSGMEMMERLLAKADPLPSAIVAGNDLIAIGAMKVLRRHGIAVPEAISIVGYDHTLLAEIVDPPLTSVAQPMQLMGSKAVELLEERIVSSRREPVKVVLPPQLVVGSSTIEMVRVSS